jgi:hypothetical protein
MKPSSFRWIAISFLFSCTTSVDLDAERQSLLDADQAWAQAASNGAYASEIVTSWSADARVMLSGLEEIVGSRSAGWESRDDPAADTPRPGGRTRMAGSVASWR